MVPIFFGSGVIFGVISLITALFSHYYYMQMMVADLYSIGFSYAVALAPMIGYISFLFYYFMIDVIYAILSLKRVSQ